MPVALADGFEDLPDCAGLLELGRRTLDVDGATVWHLALGLYEMGAITYPRATCCMLGSESADNARALAQRVVERFPDLGEIAADATQSNPAACADAHKDHLHAVTPTNWLGRLAPTDTQGVLLHALSRRFVEALGPATASTVAQPYSNEARLARRVAARLGVDVRACWWVALVLEDLRCRRMIERRADRWWRRSPSGEQFVVTAPRLALDESIAAEALASGREYAASHAWERRQREWLTQLLCKCAPAPSPGYAGCAVS